MKVKLKNFNFVNFATHLLPDQLLKVCLAEFCVVKERRVRVNVGVDSLVNNSTRGVNLTILESLSADRNGGILCDDSPYVFFHNQ